MNDAPPVIPQSPVAPGTKKLQEMARANWLVAGTEGRQAVAHGANRGDHVANNTSPVGAKGLGRMFSKATILRHSVAYK